VCAAASSGVACRLAEKHKSFALHALLTLTQPASSVDCEGAYWEMDEKVTFTHVDTGVQLFSHKKPFPRCALR